MASVTIYGISNEITSANNNDLLPIWDSENNRTAKIKKSKLLQGYQTELTFDSTPSSGSSNPVTSDGIATAIANAGSPLIVASSATVTGSTLATNSVLKFYFTADVTGSDTATALAINYNGADIPVKAVKGGALVDIYAHEIDSAYYYLQAYTTLEVIYDGTQFVVVGNPVVLSSDNYTIYADGYVEGIYKLETESIVGQWVNGKPIYRRVSDGFDTTHWSKSSGQFTSLDTLNVDTMLSNKAITSDSILTSWSSGTSGNSYSTGIRWISTGFTVINSSSGSFSGSTCIFVFEYTKTTD